LLIVTDQIMRVAAYWKTGTPWLGGWNYFLNMARVCRRFAPDIQFVLVSDGGLEPRKRDDLAAAGVELVVARPQPYWRGLLGLKDRTFEQTLRAAGVEVVFELITFHGARFGLPALSWIPDLQHRRLPHFFSRGERLKRNLDHGFRLRFRRHVMLSSEAARDDLLTFSPRPHAAIHVVPFAVQPTLAITGDGIAKTLHDHGLTTPYFFLPNQFWQHKNHGLALEAVALAAKTDPTIILVLSGQAADPRDAGYAGSLLHRIDELGITNNVRLRGMISYPDLLHLIAGGRALINPSLFEGWSTTVEEAKALGTPMLLSDLAVHREQAGGLAQFFDPLQPQELADAMRRLLRTPIENFESRRTGAEQASENAQRIYAAKLRAALAATAAG
jgi:glycosyltransferase involved in cell wall biosynthesis